MQSKAAVLLSLVAVAMMASTRAEQSGPSVTAQTDPSVPVRIAVTQPPTTVTGKFQFAVRVDNVSGFPIIALTIRYDRLDATNTIRRGGHEKHFYAATIDQMVPPGGSREFLESFDSPLYNLTAVIDFVALADGSSYGPNQTNSSWTVQATLLAQRRMLKSLLHQVKEQEPGSWFQNVLENELSARATVLRRRPA
jgi:hypothetical protein